MKIKAYLLIQSVIIICTCCTTQNKKNDNVETINIKEHKFSPLKVDQLIEQGEIINLEHNGKIVVASGSEIIHEDEKGIFILDKWMNKNVFLFSDSGRFINSFGKIGAGPGEYIAINDAIILNDKLEILSSDGNTKIYEYTLEGEFIAAIEFKTPSSFSFEFDEIRKKYFLSASNNPNAKGRLLVYDPELNETTLSFFTPNRNQSPSEINTFYKNEDGRIYYWEALGNSIYEVDSENINQIISINWGNKKELNSLNNQELSKKMSTEDVYMIKNAIITANYKLINIVHFQPKMPPISLYVLNNNKRTYYFTIEDNDYFKISPAQIINKKDQIVFLLEPQNEDFKKDTRYTNFDGYMVILKLDLRKLTTFLR